MPEFHSFQKLNNISLYILHLFIHSPVHRHLGCFHHVAIANNAVMKMGVQISLEDPQFKLFGYNPEVELLDHMEILHLTS